MKFGVLGTGMVGNAIATKLVELGHEVTMGSRTRRQRARERPGPSWPATAATRARSPTRPSSAS